VNYWAPYHISWLITEQKTKGNGTFPTNTIDIVNNQVLQIHVDFYF